MLFQSKLEILLLSLSRFSRLLLLSNFELGSFLRHTAVKCNYKLSIYYFNFKIQIFWTLWTCSAHSSTFRFYWTCLLNADFWWNFSLLSVVSSRYKLLVWTFLYNYCTINFFSPTLNSFLTFSFYFTSFFQLFLSFIFQLGL